MGGWKKLFWIALLACGLVMFAACRRTAGSADGAPSPDNLLSGRAPAAKSDVVCTECLTDGVAAPSGDHWKTTRTALFRSRGSYVVYDLGRSETVRALWLQGDNNDAYEVSISGDGVSFQQLWRAEQHPAGGMQVRHATGLEVSGRYLKVAPASGDGSYALAELQAFSQPPSPFPPSLIARPGITLDQRFRNHTLFLGLALVFVLLFTRRSARRPWIIGAALLTGLVGWQWLQALFDAWPVGSREVSLVRGMVAGVAAVAIVREVFSPRRWPADSRVVLGALAVTGAVSILAFYNLGHPQFYDKKRDTWTPVHHLDLRQYYPVSKYFKELGYTRLYDADVLAYSEDGPPLDQIAQLPMRDLNTHKIVKVGERRTQIEAVKQRFSPERWQEFRDDARFFRETMGTSHYLETMFDMGGNATPVWIGITHFLFNAFDADNRSFLLMAALDPLLLLITFVAIGRSFGLRTMFVCMVIFGANDFIMYGTNWGGATLRHDWMAYLGLAACALKTRRFVLGGVLLGLATAIRAFPALAVMAIALPSAWWALEHWTKERRLPSLKEFRERQRPTLLVIGAAAATLALLYVVTSIGFSPHAWRDWLVKVNVLTSDPHANHISLRSLIAGWEPEQARVLKHRLPVFLAGIAFFVGLVVLACRKKPLEQAAIAALILIPVFFYPANYYIHFVFLLPLLMPERTHDAVKSKKAKLAADEVRARIWAALLLMCVAQFFTVAITDKGLHFYSAGVLLFATLSFVLVTIVRHDNARWWRAAGKPAAPEPEAVSVAPAPVQTRAAGASASE